MRSSSLGRRVLARAACAAVLLGASAAASPGADADRSKASIAEGAAAPGSSLFGDLGWSVPERPRTLAAGELAGGGGYLAVAGRRTIYVVPLTVGEAADGSRPPVRAGAVRELSLPRDGGSLLSLAACTDLGVPCATTDLFVGTSTGTIYAVDLAADEPFARRWTVPGRVKRMSLAPSGRLAVVAERVVVFDGLTGERLWSVDKSLVHPMNAIVRLACTDDECDAHRVLVAGGRTLEVWDGDEGRRIARTLLPSGLVSVAMPPTEETFHVAASRHEVWFSLGDDLRTRERGALVSEVHAVFAPDPGRLVVFDDRRPAGRARVLGGPDDGPPLGAPGVPLASAVSADGVFLLYKDGTLGVVPAGALGDPR